MKYGIITAFIVLWLFGSPIMAQCSDAGACSIGTHSFNDEKKEKNYYTFGLNYSLAGSGKPKNITYHLISIKGALELNEKINFAIHIPFLIQSNSVANLSSSGLGDAIISLNASIYSINQNPFSFIGALKLPTANIDKKNFTYLNGYGTFDLISGFEYRLPFLSAAAVIQIPLTEYEDEMQKFNRGADLSLNLNYYNKLDKLNFNAQVLAIKRLAESKYMIIGNPSQSLQSIPKSDFFQLNIGVGAEYMINENLLINISTALPILKREENSDGTKRAYTIQSGIRLLLN